MNKRVVLMYTLALLAAITIGYIDTHTKTDDNLPTVLVILACTFFFGLAQPQRAWQLAFIVGVGVPAAHLTGLLFGYRPPYSVQPNVLVTFIALVPAFIGAYVGALVNLAAHHLPKGA